MEEDLKQKILQTLEKEPHGLTVQQIARLVNVNRFKATVCVHELLGEGKVVERKVGAYRLFKLKKS